MSVVLGMLLLGPGIPSTSLSATAISASPYALLSTALLSSEPSRGEVPRRAARAVAFATAAKFAALGLVTGTLGEALTDSATTLALRSHLRDGKKDVALANSMMVFLSMSLALFTQRKSEKSKEKQRLCILLWAFSQVFRLLALPFLHDGALIPLAAMVFVDKYTGPLGAASLDSALLKLLTQSSTSSTTGLPKGLPDTLLWTMRVAVARIERPICQLILLHGSLSVELLSLLFTSLTTMGVLKVLSAKQP